MKLAPSTSRRILVVAGLAALFTVVGFFVLPPVVKSQLERRLSTELGRRVTVEKVRVNPYALSLTLENFAVGERDGTTAFLAWRRLHVNFDALSSFGGEWVLSEIELDGFAARVEVKADQSLNFSDVLAKLAPPKGGVAPPAKAGRPVRVGTLRVTGAKVDLSDLSRKQRFATTVGPLTFVLTEFRSAGERGAPYWFVAETEVGEKLGWSGTLQAVPFRSAGQLKLENISLPKYAPYYSDFTQADLVAGQLSVSGRYEINLTEGQRALKLSEGAVQLRGLQLLERANREKAVDLPALDVVGAEVDGLTRKITVRSISLAGGQLRVRREKDGTINLLTMLRPAGGAPPASPTPATAPTTAASTAATPVKQPDIAVGELGLKDFQVEWSDQAAPRPAQLALKGIQVSVKNISLAEGAQLPVQVALEWAPRGTVNVGGTVGLNPIKADLQTDVTDLDFLPLSPYLEQFVSARLTQGVLTAALATQVALTTGQPLAATVAGDVKIEKLGVVDGARNEELVGFGALTLLGLRASTAPELSVALKEITVAGPYARLVVGADKTLNLATVFPTTPAATPSVSGGAVPPVTAPAAPPPKIEIGKVVITDGDYRFTDRSIEPNVSTAITQLGGTVAGLSSVNLAKADVDLKATVDGAGPVAIKGQLDPLGAKMLVDLKVDFKNVDLLPLSPYSGKFAGYELARGKLTLDTKLLIDGKMIDAANVLTLNQFTFGGPVKSADATGLPVRLGVALLKDMEGKIVIDVPVQGRTDDPNFRIGRVVLRVVTNLLTKAATSPFALLGSAFGGGGDELAYQEFRPGSTELQPAELKKLQTMVQALTNRPALSVGFEGSYDAAADAYALKQTKLDDQIRRAIWETKHVADPNSPPPAQLIVTAEDSAAMIKKLFDAKFPPGTQFGTPLPVAPAVVAPPPPPAGFFKRVIRLITFQGQRDARAAQKENEHRAAEHTRAVTAATAAGLPLEDMRGRLAEAMAIDDNDLRALAQARAQQVRDYFVATGKIAPDRLFLAKATAAGDAAKTGKGPRVFLELQ